MLDECCSTAIPESEDSRKKEEEEEEEEGRGILKAFSFVKVFFFELTSCFCCTELVYWVRIAMTMKCFEGKT